MPSVALTSVSRHSRQPRVYSCPIPGGWYALLQEAPGIRGQIPHQAMARLGIEPRTPRFSVVWRISVEAPFPGVFVNSRWLVRVFPDFAVLCRLIRPTEGSVGLFLALHIEVAHQVLADLLVGGHVRRPGLGTSRQNALSRLVVRKSASSSSMRGSRPLDSNVGRRNCASQVG